MLKTYKTCPQKYKLKYVEKFSLPQRFGIFEKGKKIHALAFYYLRGDDITRMETGLNAEELRLWEQLKANKFFNLKTYQAEYDLNCKYAGHWIGGRLDAVVTDGDNGYYILDYKTGSIPQNPQKDLQTLAYLVAMHAHLGGKYSCLKFVYIDLKNNQNHIIDYNDIEPTIIAQICAGIEKEKFSRNLQECKTCEYRHYCS